MSFNFDSIALDIDHNKVIDFLYESVTFEFFIKFVIIYLFIIWVSVFIWVYKDISNRTDSILLQLLSVLVILCFTPLGIFLYLIIRPSKTLLERSYEEIEYNLDIIAEFVENHTKARKQKKVSTNKKTSS